MPHIKQIVNTIIDSRFYMDIFILLTLFILCLYRYVYMFVMYFFTCMYIWIFYVRKNTLSLLYYFLLEL